MSSSTVVLGNLAAGSFLDAFEGACRRAPTAPALLDPERGRRLGYGELDRRSRRLAAALERRGIGPEVRVGVMMERSAELLVAVLGVLRAGGVYLPLDPAYPPAQLDFMVDDAEAALVLTSAPREPASGQPMVAGVETASIAELEAEPAGCESPPTRAPSRPVSGEAAAYLIYTSGSTGRPKGVVLPHRALAWYCLACADHYRLTRDDRILHLASISFDVSIGELFPALATGAALVLHPGGSAPSVPEILDRCRRAGVTVLFPATALWHELARALAAEPEALPPSLRLVSFGGEKVVPERIADWLRGVGERVRLVNGYGPTETTVEATIHPLVAGPATGAGEPPASADPALIGRPVLGVRAEVLDRRLRPVPAGVAGELCLSSPGTARGYLRRPAETARSFVPDPGSDAPGARLYRTGDRVRRRPDGTLEILGRLDRQVKIRGHRVEPGEVEAALLEHPAVRDAAVVAREESPGSRRLVAFLVLEDATPADGAGRAGTAGILGVGGGGSEGGGSVDEIRGFLRRRQPPQMIPAAWETLDALPLGANGKVDRAALARRPPELPAGGGTPPRTATEATLARIWSRVLRLERVGVDADFLELGGDSILAIRIVTAAHRRGLRLSPGDLFTHPTIAALAAAAEARGVDDAGGDEASRGEPPPEPGPVPLTPVQRWFFRDSGIADPHHFNQSMLLALRRPLEPAVLRWAAAALVAHHDAFRLRFERAVDGVDGWRQLQTEVGDTTVDEVAGTPVDEVAGTTSGGDPVVEVDLGGLAGAHRRRALVAAAGDLQRSLHLGRGPLFRLALLHPGDGDPGRLLFAVHHLVVDGVTWGILLADLERLCRHTAGDRPPPTPPALPPRTTSFRRWAELQERHGRSPELRAELPLWLARPSTAAPLPLDRLSSAGLDAAELERRNTMVDAERVSAVLSRRRTALLLRRAPAPYRSHVNDLLLTALARTFRRWTGRPDLLLDLEGHGREEIFPGVDLSRTAGWFTTTFPVHLRLPGDAEPGEELLAVKEQLRAVPRRGIGYGILHDLAGDPEVTAALDALPRPEVSFNYLGQLDALLDGSELFAAAAESRGEERCRHRRRGYLIEVDGGVVDGRLWIHWSYSRRLHRRGTVAELARSFRAELETILDHCLSPDAGGYSPSDFPLAGLHRRQLRELFATDRDVAERDVADLYPLTPMQEGMLLHTLREPGSGIYFEQSAWTLDGDLDRRAFREAWRRLAERHAVLRTAFLRHGLERPLQLVRREASLPVVELDLRRLGAAARGRALAAILRADRRHGFDLHLPPLMRVLLVRLAHHRYRFVWSYHHALLDGWSIALLFDRCFALYGALRRGRLPPATRRRPFRDFVAWLERRDRGAEEAFWRRELAGVEPPPPFEVGPARGPGDRAGIRRGEARRRLPAPLTADLAAAARRHRVTLGTLVQGAWALLLGRYHDRDEVLFGATVAGRPAELPGADGIVGILIDTLPVRVPVADPDPIGPWLAELQRRSLELRRFGHASLVEIRRWAGVAADRPLFHTLLVFENYPAEAAMEDDQERQGLRIRDFSGWSVTELPVTLGVLPGRRLGVEVSSDPSCLDATAAARLLRHLETLLTSLATAPAELPLGELSLLTAAERHQLLHEHSATGPPIADPDGPLFLDLFAGTAARRPEAPAAIASGDPRAADEDADEEGGTLVRVLSYGELARRADRLARRLRRLGVERESPVAVLLGRRLELPVAILGVLAAGGAYLPLDPADPPERLAAILADAGAKVAVTRRGLRERLPEAVTAVAVDGAEDADDADDAGDEPLPDAGHRLPGANPVPPGSAAYLIYTSGSTGRPKGVVVAHRSLAWYTAAAARHYRLGPGDRLLQSSSLGFDVSVSEIFPTLAAGGTLLLHDGAGGAAVPGLLRRCRDHRATVLMPATALWHELAAALASGSGELPASLRLAAFGGERVLDPRLADWRRAVGDRVRLVNGYGPTETAVEAAVHDLGDGRDRGPRSPGDDGSVIGRPVRGARLYVLDRRLRPVPAGVWGELHVAGPGVARGYLARPAATAGSFLPNPFPHRPGGRIYRTGDVVRFRPDGRLEILGRRDHQVKVRGFRVEPGEVETALLRLGGVREAAVVAPRGPGGTRRLVAFVAGDAGLDPGTLRRRLGGRLPPYLVPAEVVAAGSLPRLPSGKVDRRELEERAAEGAGAASRDGHRRPRSPVAEIVAGVFRRVLGVTEAGEDDGFFELGGHSLLATRTIAELRRVFGVELPLRRLFESPTVGGVASAVEAMLAGEGTPLDPAGREPIEAGGLGGPLPLSFGQERLFFLERLTPGDPGHLLPDGWELRGPLEPAALGAALRALRRRHRVLRATFALEAGEPRQRIAAGAGGGEGLPRIDLRHLPPARRRTEADRIARTEARRPFDLASGPLLRALLLHLGAGEHRFLRTLHHLVTDGASEEIFYRELGTLYRAAVAGSPSPLPTLPIQYPDFARHQRRRLAGDRLEALLDHWRRRLDGVSELQLPTDRPRRPLGPRDGRRRVRRRRRPLREVTGTSLRRLVQDAGASLFMTFTAAFAVLLGRTAGDTDLPVGAPLGDRRRPELEGLIGFFVDTVVLRLDLAGDPAFRPFLERVRDVALDAYTHGELPFERLVDELRPERRPGRHPLFQVMVEVVAAPRPRLVLPGIEARWHDLGDAGGPFDLSLTVEPEGEGFAADLEYDAGLFDAVTAERLLARYDVLLGGLLADPDRRISAAPLLPPGERHQLLHEQSRPAAAPPAASFRRLFAAQLQARPEAVAVVCGVTGAAVSYRRLAADAGRVARRLRARGAGPEVLVALALDRSLGQLTAVLGVLAAGAAYLPLDPAWPRRRRDRLLADAGAELLVERGEGGESTHDLRSLALTPPAPLSPGERGEPRPGPPRILQLSSTSLPSPSGRGARGEGSPDAAAYLLHTSGSTGAPKGVLVPRRALGWYAATAARHYHLGPGERVLHFSPLTFDASVEEIFPTFAAGATLVLRDDGAAGSTGGFRGFCARHRVGCASLPTAFWHELADAAAADPATIPPVLAKVIVGGERIDPRRVAGWRRSVGDRARLWDGYGPTETTVVATLEPLAGGRAAPGPPTLGRPVAGAVVHLLDRRMRPVPTGASGELFLGGSGIARGYHRRPAATAASFLPDPWPPRPGGRLYRTGDLARRRHDGRLEFLGRRDRQLKVRGFRIEPGEVEAALREHPAVTEAAVVAAPSGNGQRLAAWVVTAVPVEQLRAFLAERLPAHLLPSLWLGTARLPRSATGKVDLRELEQGAARRRGGTTAEPSTYAPPRDRRERLLVDVFERVLGVAPVGVHDGFFDLGGDSIRSMRVVDRARRAGLRLHARDLFRHPTVAALAAVAEAGEAAAIAGAEQGVVTGPVPLTPIQRWFFGWRLTERRHFNQSALVAVRRPLSPITFHDAVRRLLRHHDALRLRFARDGDRWRQRLEVAGAHLPGSWHDLSRLPAEPAHHVAGEAAEALQGSLDLERGPLLRIAYFHRAGDDPDLLLVIVHHLAVDVVSWEILMEDFEGLCLDLAAGRPPALPPKTTSYRWWAETLHAQAKNGATRRELPYWLELLRRNPGPLPVDADGAGGGSRGPGPASWGSVRASLDVAETTGLLRRLPATFGTGVDAALLTTLARALAPWSGRRRLLVELEGHGREEVAPGIDLSRTVGWFTATFPVLLELGDGDDPTRDLRRTGRLLRAVPGRGIGYGILRHLADANDNNGDGDPIGELRSLPGPELRFNYLGRLDATLETSRLFAPPTGNGDEPGAIPPLDEPAGPEQAHPGERLHLLDLTSHVSGGRLHLDWGYSPAHHRRATIEKLAERHLAELRNLLAGCGDLGGEVSES